MSAHVFEEEAIEAHGERVLAAKVTCDECSAHGYFAHKRGAARRPPDAIAAHFRKQGWELKGAKIRCPQCARRRPRVMVSKGFEMKTTGQKPAVPAVIDVAAVRVPGFDDKQVINLKLIEVYQNAEVGYREGWTDARVAQELGCPKEWVSDVRGAMFGPEGMAPHLRALERNLATYDKYLQQLAAEQVEAFRSLKHMLGEINTLEGNLRQQYAAVETVAVALRKQFDAAVGGTKS